MNVKSADADRYVARPPSGLVAALLYRSRPGLVRERAERLAKTVVRISRILRISELDDAALSGDPARLSDEASALSMMGGRRVVRCAQRKQRFGQNCSKLSSLHRRPATRWLWSKAGIWRKAPRWREAFEDAENAAAIPCYADSEAGLSEILRSALKAEGLAIATDALDLAAASMGADRGPVSRREIEKLALYAHGKERVTIEDVRAVIGDEAEARRGRSLRCGRRRRHAEARPRAGASLGRRLLADCHPAHGDVAFPTHRAREGPGIARRKHRHCYQADAASHSFPAHVVVSAHRSSVGTSVALGEVLDLLLDTEALCKTTGVPAEAVCGRALLTSRRASEREASKQETHA